MSSLSRNGQFHEHRISRISFEFEPNANRPVFIANVSETVKREFDPAEA